VTSLRPITWKGRFCLALVLMLSVSSPALADPSPATAPSGTREAASDAVTLSGTARMSYFGKDKSFSDRTGYGVGSLWVTANPKDIWGISTYFDARVQGQDLSRNANLNWELREGYAQTGFDNIDIRAGRQITVWGRADKLNPTDVWSVKDLTLLAPNDEDQRLGVTSTQGTWTSGTFHIIGIWQPEWRFPKYPIPPIPGISLRNLRPQDPAQQAGLKLDHSGEGVDWSVSYSHSIDHVPDLEVLSSGPGRAELGLHYQPIDTFGGDFAVPVGQYGLRGEVAYEETNNSGGSDPLTKKSNVYGVFGGERTFGGELTINVQYVFRWTPDFRSPASFSDPNQQLLASEVNIISNQLNTFMQGASLRVNYKAWNETLESELALATWTTKNDWALRPKVSYAFTDRIKGIVGGEIYAGPQDSLFGQLRHTSTVFTELQIGF